MVSLVSQTVNLTTCRPAHPFRSVQAAAQLPAKRTVKTLALPKGSVSLAAAALLLASPVHANQIMSSFSGQQVAEIAAANTESNVKTEAAPDTNAYGTPGSQSRFPPGQPLPGDEAKIREARRALEAEEKQDLGRKSGYTKTNSFLDPYGRKESAGANGEGRVGNPGQ